MNDAALWTASGESQENLLDRENGLLQVLADGLRLLPNRRRETVLTFAPGFPCAVRKLWGMCRHSFCRD